LKELPTPDMCQYRAKTLKLKSLHASKLLQI